MTRRNRIIVFAIVYVYMYMYVCVDSVAEDLLPWKDVYSSLLPHIRRGQRY